MKSVLLDSNTYQEAVKSAVSTLKAGGLVLFPTETTYGAGVDATNPEAVQKLLEYKSRREGKPLSIAVTDQDMASKYVELNEQAKKLYKRFLPGPVTVVSKVKPGSVAPGVASEFDTLGVRIPAYPFVIDVISQLGVPITATSANGSGEKRPYKISDVLERISDKQKSLIDLCIDAGTLPENPPSTVIDTTLETPITLRQGEVILPESTGAQTTIVTHSEEETTDLAGKLLLKLWDQLKETGVIIALDGPLGAGKTAFTKGIARFLQISEPVTSPTYGYRSDYEFTRHGVSGRLYHFDWWKVESIEQLSLLEFPAVCQPKTVTVVEWWSPLAGELPADFVSLPILHVQFEDRGETTRSLTVTESSK